MVWLSSLFLALSVSSITWAKKPPVADYKPGKFITVDRYEQLKKEFFVAWEGTDPFATAMQKTLDETEPEAVLALLKILESADARVSYGGFDPVYVPKYGHEIHSRDGLLGLRVIRQIDVEVNRYKHLLSSIQAYDWDPDTETLLPRQGPDGVRVRIEIEPYQPSEDGKPARGFVGFSWWTSGKKGRIKSVYAKNYVTDDKKLWLKEGHSGSYDSRTSPCSWTTHCNVCHHASARTVYGKNYFDRDPSETRGASEFLTYLEEDRKLSEEQVAAVKKSLADPRKTFPTQDLQKALRKRWYEIKP